MYRKEPIVINKKMDPLTIPNDRLGKGIRPLFICVGFEVKFQKGISNGTIEWGTVEDVAEGNSRPFQPKPGHLNH